MVINQWNCDESNDLAVHVESRASCLVKVVMNEVRELANIYSFDDKGRIPAHWAALGIYIPLEPFELVWNEEEKGLGAMHRKRFHLRNER